MIGDDDRRLGVRRARRAARSDPVVAKGEDARPEARVDERANRSAQRRERLRHLLRRHAQHRERGEQKHAERADEEDDEADREERDADEGHLRALERSHVVRAVHERLRRVWPHAVRVEALDHLQPTRGRLRRLPKGVALAECRVRPARRVYRLSATPALRALDHLPQRRVEKRPEEKLCRKHTRRSCVPQHPINCERHRPHGAQRRLLQRVCDLTERPHRPDQRRDPLVNHPEEERRAENG